MEGTIAEIRLFAGNFAPRNWAFCAGQTVAIASNTALFSLLGTTYGGNGQTTFVLPNLQGRVAMGNGNGPGLTPRSLGQVLGTPNYILQQNEMPAHNHFGNVVASGNGPSTTQPRDGYLGKNTRALPLENMYAAASDPAVKMDTSGVQIGVTGGSQPHENTQPYLALNYIICQFGIFPSRN